MREIDIHAMADASASALFEEIPNEHLAKLSQDEREQLLVDLQDALADVLIGAFGKAS